MYIANTVEKSQKFLKKNLDKYKICKGDKKIGLTKILEKKIFSLKHVLKIILLQAGNTFFFKQGSFYFVIQFLQCNAAKKAHNRQDTLKDERFFCESTAHNTQSNFTVHSATMRESRTPTTCVTLRIVSHVNSFSAYFILFLQFRGSFFKYSADINFDEEEHCLH